MPVSTQAYCTHRLLTLASPFPSSCLQVTDAESEAVFKRLTDEAHGGSVPPVLSQAVKDGILVNIR